MLNQEVDALRRIKLFSNIDTSKLKLLAFASERVIYEPGKVLFREGDRADAAYMILDGSADVIINSPKGPVTVSTIQKDTFVGEVAVLCDVPRTATVTAVTRVDALKIRKDVFFQLLHDVPSMAVEVMRELAERLDATNDRLLAANVRLREAGLE
jgi:CRP-like cAMP-binding protein